MKADIEKQTELEFDQAGYTSTIVELKNFIQRINERPVESEDPLSINALKRNGIINESFLTLCSKLGFTPSYELLTGVLNKNETAVVAFLNEMFDTVLKGQNLHSSLIPAIKKANDSIIYEFAKIIQRLNNSYSRLAHDVLEIKRHKRNIIEYVSFSEGVAVISDETKDELKELFTTRMDSPLRKEIFTLLSGISDSVNKFNKALARCKENGMYYNEMEIDGEYLTYEDGKVLPKPSAFRYF